MTALDWAAVATYLAAMLAMSVWVGRGSLFYGPILGVFVVALHSRRATAPSAALGMASALAFEVATWQLLPSVSWLWWNVIGFVACVGVSWSAGSAAAVELRRDVVLRGNALTAFGLVAAAALVIGACVALQAVAS
ncbi:MAG: hypothetical protein HYR85_19350 [Planctomycetes bacterium]|nr:hypothetical protein [Planctomycetota bacterium]MBI3843734.1 hypothetical protein [Planctomycetota bacterium]